MNNREKAKQESIELLTRPLMGYSKEEAEKFVNVVEQFLDAAKFDTTKHYCSSCGEETEHRIQENDIKSMPDYKLVICQECDNKELVPESALGETRQEVEVDNASVDEQRQIDDGCESGACPSR